MLTLLDPRSERFIDRIAPDWTILPGNCRQASGTLVDLALEHGRRDNISAVVVRAEDLESGDRTLFNPTL